MENNSEAEILEWLISIGRMGDKENVLNSITAINMSIEKEYRTYLSAYEPYLICGYSPGLSVPALILTAYNESSK